MEGDWRNRGKPGGKEEKEKGLQLPASSETHVNSFDQLEYLDDNNDESENENDYENSFQSLDLYQFSFQADINDLDYDSKFPFFN